MQPTKSEMGANGSGKGKDDAEAQKLSKSKFLDENDHTKGGNTPVKVFISVRLVSPKPAQVGGWAGKE